MKNWLKCKISSGQFTGEFAIQGSLFNNSDFSMFAEKEYLEFTENPTDDHPVDGWIRVETLDKKDNLFLVALPQPTFENGQIITVKAEMLK